MIGVVVISHGKLAVELIKTAEQIVGRLKQVAGVELLSQERVETSREKILKAIREVDKGRGVLLLTDMLGGNPSCVAFSFHEEGKVEVLTGMNLPMLIELRDIRQKNLKLTGAARRLRDCGKHNISLATEMLRGKKSRDEKKES